MATTKFYLDTRATKDGAEAPLKLSITHKGKTVQIPLGIKLRPTNWDERLGKVTGLPNKAYLNTYIIRRKQDIDTIILKLAEQGEIGSRSTPKEIKDKVIAALHPEEKREDLFAERFKKFTDGKKGRTRELYQSTYRRMLAYDSGLEKLVFTDITKEWLTGFDAFMERTSPAKNARNIHLRNIRAVFNDALDDEVTTFYPFRRFKIRPVATPKRSLTVEQLRVLFGLQVEEYEQKYLDMFKLIFFLVGINVVDLCGLKEIKDGRIEYYRSKTGRLYSIKVEPEAAAIIAKYRGRTHLLDIMDRYTNYRGYAKRLNGNLQLLGPTETGKQGRKTHHPLFPYLTTYYARHTWATIAASLDIPKETIAAALGHGGHTVTDIYIDFDQKKVDEANRRVIDYVLGIA